AVIADVRALKFKVHVPLADALWKEAQAARQAGDTATENIKLWELTHFAPRGIPAVVRDARNRLYQISQEAHQAYMQAFTNHLVPGHYEAASAAFKTIAAKYPLTEAAEKCLFNAGGALEKADAPDEALRRYAALLKQYPQSSLFPITCFKLACYYQDQKKDYAKAEEYFRLAVDRMPEGPHADLCQYMLGTLFYQTGNFKRCYEEQKKFLKNYPESDLRARGLLQVQVIEKNGWKEVTKGEPQVPGKPAAAKAQEGGKR
ncbi:MAG: tetratricopeptide repeat protein, partial [Planctomycetes bacterium]|nr:tetratricopeptide repeat protein [Planctomycetota bacterium]